MTTSTNHIHQVNDRITEAEDHGDYSVGVTISTVELAERRLGVVVQPTPQEIAEVNEMTEGCELGEWPNNGMTLVAWDDYPDEREWTSWDEIIRYRVVD
jgi:hypothetical protein